MRKLPVIFALLTVFACTSVSHGMARVYKGTITASKTVFDVNDTNNFIPLSVQGYWTILVLEENGYAYVVDSNAVIYDKKREWIKMIPHAITIDPCDPCKIEMLSFTATDAEGTFTFDVTGKGKLVKDSNDPNEPKSYIPTTMKGTGLLSNFDLFSPFETYSGPVTVTLTLDTKRTLQANSNNYDDDEILNIILDDLTAKGTWANWPYLPPPPP
jgi:hypothetical protein